MDLTLYELSDQYRQATERLADMDLPDDVIADTLEALVGDLQTKATSVAMFVRNLESMSVAIKDAETKMAARRRAIDARVMRVREYIKLNMELAGIMKISCPFFEIAVKKNPPAVVIDDESLVPDDYKSDPPPPPKVPDKTLIGKALKDGYVIDGAHLEQRTRLEIK